MESNSILNDVVGYVEVRSSYDNRSAAIAKEMEQLGARVLTTFTDDVTHVVFKEGMKRTWNKAMKRGIPLVSVSWLDSCKQRQQRVPEKDFPALIPEDNSGSPLLRFNPAPRWKKFKSMQPCDFEEDLAKSAEKLEKRLKRKIKADRFNPREEVTPTMSSHLRILAMDTQARTPNVPWDNASPSFIPETPQSMRVRLERMRQEQREVLSPDYESPTVTPKQLLAPTRHPRHLLDKLVSCTSSDNSNDNEEAMSRMVAGIIQNLDSSSCSQSPVCKTMPQKKIPSGLVTSLGMQSLTNLIGTKTEEHEIICDENFSLCRENVSMRKSNSSDHHSRTSAKPLSPQDLNTEKSPSGWEATKGSAKPCNKESTLGFAPFGCEEKQNLYPSRDAPKVADSLISEGDIKDFSLATCSENGKQQPNCRSAYTKVGSDQQPLCRSVYTKVGSDLAGWDSDTAENTADQLKAKPAKKRKLLTGNQFYSLQGPATVIGLNGSPEAPSSSKCNGDTPSSTDTSFLFGITESKTGPKLKSDRRRSERLQSTQVNKSYLKSRRRSVNQNSSSNGTLNEQSINISLDVTANTRVNESTQRNTLGTSMSVMYPNDASTDRSTTSRSRLSMDDFSLNKKTSVAAKKRRRESPNATVKLIPKGMSLSSVTTNSNGRLKPDESSSKEVKKKSSSKISATITQPSEKPIKRKRVPSSSSGGDTDTSLNRSSSAHKAEGTRASLRHARSLILEQPHKLINRKLPYSLVVTSLHREEQELTYSVVKKLGIFQLTNNVDSTTTHVVCGEPRRTLNVLQAIARGCWVLKKEWVLESLESGEWLEEDKYEMDADFPSAKKSRLERQKAGVLYKMDLFSKKGPIYVSDNCTPKRTDVVHLINLCCGHVTGSKVRAAIHIGDKHDPEKIVIRPTWVLDCIMKMETLSVNTEQYIVPPPTPSSQRECSPEF